MDVSPDRSADPGRWPLSAPATALLRDPAAAPPALLRLALRELVVRGTLAVRAVEQRGRRPPTVRLAPSHAGTAGLPPALHLLADALLPHLGSDGTSAATAVQRASGWRADLASRVRDAARYELVTTGLLVREQDRLLGVVPRTRWRLTPSGQAWARSASDAAAVSAGLLPATGLLLALDQDLQRRLRDTAVADGHGSATWDDHDLDALDTVLGDAGPGLDSAADAGSGSSGGDGGDGGGGGD